MTRRMLIGCGYRVLETEDGAAVMAIWTSHQDEIDLLHTDTVLPGALSGLQLAERLRGEKPGLKVIITSGPRQAA